LAKTITEYRCILISPSDVANERALLSETVRKWNAQVGVRLNCRVELVRWESHSVPDLSASPQGIINQQILNDCDLGVAIFWSRLGTPTEKHNSGSLEELSRLRSEGKRVMVYFCDRAIPQEALDNTQFSILREFRSQLMTEGLVGTYAETRDLTEQFYLHLTNILSESINNDTPNVPLKETHRKPDQAKVDTLLGSLRIADELAKTFTLAELDIRGFGPSRDEKPEEDHFDCYALKVSPHAIIEVAAGMPKNGVKTRSFYVSKDALAFVGKEFFYIFVAFAGLYSRPDFFIVPSGVVASRVSKRTGAPSFVTIRSRTFDVNDHWYFEDKSEEFLEKWNLLGTPQDR
jgi:hypothetical protein